MSNYVKYNIKNRYSVGWTDPRAIFGSEGLESPPRIKIGDYVLAELFLSSSTDRSEYLDMAHIPTNGLAESTRVKKEEFAACIEAFLQEKKSEDTNGRFRDVLHQHGLGVQDPND